jgi:hypothetical protein
MATASATLFETRKLVKFIAQKKGGARWLVPLMVKNGVYSSLSP